MIQFVLAAPAALVLAAPILRRGAAPRVVLWLASTRPLRARVARYEAKAFSADTAGILTNNDVVTTANAEGMQKTCVQEVGSNSLSGSSASTLRYGPNQAPQVVVLRGDLVNICR